MGVILQVHAKKRADAAPAATSEPATISIFSPLAAKLRLSRWLGGRTGAQETTSVDRPAAKPRRGRSRGEMSHQILVVDSNAGAARDSARALRKAGYRVAVAPSFLDAAHHLRVDSLDLLVTALRLEAHNGVHLVFRCRAQRADFPVVLTGALGDLTMDIRRLAVPYLITPVDTELLVETARELLRGRPPRDGSGIRRWPRKWAALPVTVSREAARIVELSYGGIRLELASTTAAIDQPLEVAFPTIGMRVTVRPRWVVRLPDLSCWCGAELALPDSSAVRRSWRTLVDSIS
jgi:DNA-binding response OmpR family regulator